MNRGLAVTCARSRQQAVRSFPGWRDSGSFLCFFRGPLTVVQLTVLAAEVLKECFSNIFCHIIYRPAFEFNIEDARNLIQFFHIFYLKVFVL